MIQVIVSDTTLDFDDIAIQAIDQNLKIHQHEDTYVLIQNDKVYRIKILEIFTEEKKLKVLINDKQAIIGYKSELMLNLEKYGLNKVKTIKLNQLKAPMPGLIKNIAVEIGQNVSVGDNLLTLEAMKMENIIKASGVGVVKAIQVTIGQSVEKNEILLDFE
ncbi:MAG: hypothetical protein MUE53_06075 [Chitinophagales bacterium]|jgi:acetyl/propionyl-CoA carboxylase alpha subunit|nr:hypothetical protein [Chitinophagales bacterium]